MFLGMDFAIGFAIGLFDLPALDKAMAIACFCGTCSFRMVLIFSPITFWLFPDFRGITVLFIVSQYYEIISLEHSSMALNI